MKKHPLAIAAIVVLASSTALAEPPPADVLLARQLAAEGSELAQKGDCVGALEKLGRAEAIHHAPTLLVRIGECQKNLGRYVDALVSLDRVVREKLEPTPPRAFVLAQERAAKLLPEVRAKVAMLRVDVTGPRDGATFTLDGAELNAATLGLERPIDPGKHVVEATVADGRKIKNEIDLQEGGGGTITLVLPAAKTAATPADGTPEPQKKNGLRTLGWGLAIGGGAALVTSAVFAGLTLSKKSSLDDACGGGKTCPSSSRSDYDAAQTTATVSGVAFVVGVVAVGAGVVLILTQKPKDTTASALTGRFEF
jgi:hypothetical protein